jgi:outer membrane scaffolding protein for murein synthesis (MipA/OmpV family)
MSRNFFLCVLLLMSGAFTTAVRAQSPSSLPEWSYSAGELMRTSMEPTIPEWSIVAGLSTEYVPRYDGARDYHVQAGPMLDMRYRDIAFLATGEGLGVNLLRGKKYRAGVALSYDLGRRAQDSADTRGLGNVGAAPEFKFFGEYLIFPVVLRADLRRGLGGHNGWLGDFGVYMPVYGTQKLFVFAGPSVTVADATYMRHYFSVTPGQAAATSYPQYSAGAGLKAANLGTSITWLCSEHWLVNAMAGGARLLGDAADSPLTLKRTQYTATLTAGYQF